MELLPKIIGIAVLILTAFIVLIKIAELSDDPVAMIGNIIAGLILAGGVWFACVVAFTI